MDAEVHIQVPLLCLFPNSHNNLHRSQEYDFGL